MALYEHIFLARQDVSPQQVEEMTTTLTGVITEGGGKVTKNEYWGLKSLSYRIKKNRKAHYSLLNIDAPSAAVAEMERVMRINEDILRFMTVRIETIDEAPSSILSRKSDDRERGFRGPKPPGRFDSGRGGGARRGYDDREEFRARDEFRPEDVLGGEE